MSTTCTRKCLSRIKGIIKLSDGLRSSALLQELLQVCDTLPEVAGEGIFFYSTVLEFIFNVGRTEQIPHPNEITFWIFTLVVTPRRFVPMTAFQASLRGVLLAYFFKLYALKITFIF